VILSVSKLILIDLRRWVGMVEPIALDKNSVRLENAPRKTRCVTPRMDTLTDVN
jgi:hypothetical protein